MKKYILCSFLSLGSIFYAQTNQVGIDTPAPKALFHVDGGKDNPKNPATALTPAQVANDVVVTTSGNVGIANITPATKLDIYNGTTNGAIKIVDGTQGVGKVLMSDANGVGTWVMPNSFKSTALGVYPKTAVVINSNGTANYIGEKLYTQIYIDLTPGKWIVNAGLTVRATEALGARFWMHAYLSTSQTSVVQNGFTHLGPAGTTTTYANLIFANPNTASNPFGNQGSNFISGSSVINVTANVRLYLLIDNSNRLPRDDERVGSFVFSTDAYENYFHAIPVE